MPISLTARFLERHIWGILKSTKELMLTGVISCIVLASQYLGGGLTREAWRNSFWKEAYPLVTVFAGLAIWHAVKAAYLLVREVELEPKTKSIESAVLLASGNKHTELVTVPPVSFLRFKVWTVAVLLSLLYGLCAYLAWSKSKPAFTPPVVPQEVPTVEVRYLPGQLPVLVAPDSTVLLLALNLKNIGWPDEIRNDDSNKTLSYPPNFVPDKDNVDMFNLYSCQLTNHGDKDLVNVRIHFRVVFHAIDDIPVISKLEDGKCKFSATWPLIGKDHLNWAQGTGPNKHCVAKAFTEGKEIFTQDRWAVVSSIPGHKTRTIDLVNASFYPVRFVLPDRGMAVISGQERDSEITLIRPRVGLFDATPSWGMIPMLHKWPNAPDDSKLP